MPKKATSLVAIVVAVIGFTLAICISAASAAKPHNTYTEYCEDGTNTVYGEYDQYCESTTTTGSTTGATSSPTKTTITPGTTSTSTSTPTAPASNASITLPAGVTINNITAAELAAILANIPGVVDKGGVVSIASVGAGLPIGTPLAKGVQVIGNANGVVEIDDNGVVLDVPYGAELSVSASGVALVTYQKSLAPLIRPAFRSLAPKREVTVSQTVLLPKKETAQRFAYVLPKGVSFGRGISWASIAKAFTITQPKVESAKRVADRPVIATKTPFVVAAANKARNAFTLKTKKAAQESVITFNLSALKYTAAEVKAIQAQGIKSLKPSFAVKQGAAGHLKATRFAFSYGI